MRITSKGQVTIPQDIRERAGLLPGTDVEFVLERGNVTLKPVTKTKSRARLAIERARGTANEPMFRGWTTDQIMGFLRSED